MVDVGLQDMAVAIDQRQIEWLRTFLTSVAAIQALLSAFSHMTILQCISVHEDEDLDVATSIDALWSCHDMFCQAGSRGAGDAIPDKDPSNETTWTLPTLPTSPVQGKTLLGSSDIVNICLESHF